MEKNKKSITQNGWCKKFNHECLKMLCSVYPNSECQNLEYINCPNWIDIYKIVDLLKRFYESAHAIDMNLCTMINHCDITPSNKNERLEDYCMTGDEYDKHMDIFIEVEKFLGGNIYEKNKSK